MPNLLIRDLAPELIERLKAQAKRNRRSVQAEVKEILETTVQPPWEEVVAELEAFRKSLGGRRFSDSAALIRENRDA